jgi:hypothetical protein
MHARAPTSPPTAAANSWMMTSALIQSSTSRQIPHVPDIERECRQPMWVAPTLKRQHWPGRLQPASHAACRQPCAGPLDCQDHLCTLSPPVTSIGPLAYHFMNKAIDKVQSNHEGIHQSNEPEPQLAMKALSHQLTYQPLHSRQLHQLVYCLRHKL